MKKTEHDEPEPTEPIDLALKSEKSTVSKRDSIEKLTSQTKLDTAAKVTAKGIEEPSAPLTVPTNSKKPKKVEENKGPADLT